MEHQQPVMTVTLSFRQAQNEARWKALWDWLLAPRDEPDRLGDVDQEAAGDVVAYESEVAHGDG
jgi:hypothetical protein